jgi:flagellar motor switch protein FliM
MKKVNLAEVYKKNSKTNPKKAKTIKEIMEKSVLGFNKYLQRFLKLGELKLTGIEGYRYEGLVNSIEETSTVAYFKPINQKGSFLVEVDNGLANFLIDVSLGGSPTEIEVNSIKKLTKVDEKMLSNVLEYIYFHISQNSKLKELASITYFDEPSLIGYCDKLDKVIVFNYTWIESSLRIIVKPS